MKSLIRKNEGLPDPERLVEIFRDIKENPEKPQSKRVEEFLELLSRLREDLSTSEKVPIIIRLRGLLGAYQWTVQVSPTPEGFRAIHLIANREKLSPDDLWEREAVRDLMGVVPYLDKRPIRRCAECQEWFFAAKREDQQWCNGNCRQRHYDSNPDIRASKKRYMRQYRVDEKKREESSKKRVTRK
jgi:hypothetical protein